MTNSDTNVKAAIKKDRNAPSDSGEALSLIEPTRISETSRHREGLADLAVELAAHAAGFRHSLPKGVLTARADLVRSMNTPFSMETGALRA